jgi:hypothetical protein
MAATVRTSKEVGEGSRLLLCRILVPPFPPFSAIKDTSPPVILPKRREYKIYLPGAATGRNFPPGFSLKQVDIFPLLP